MNLLSIVRRWRREHWFIVLAAIGIVVLLAWAATGSLAQAIRVQGAVTARGRTQTIQAATDGVLSHVDVDEGQQVARGQVLATLEGEQAEAALQDSEGKVAALKAALVRLRAEALGQPLDFPSDLAAAFPDFVENQRLLFAARRRAMQDEVASLQENARLVDQQIEISRPLVANGDMGRLELIALGQRHAELHGAISNRRNRYFTEAQADMTKAEEDLATQEQVLADRKTMIERNVMRSPVRGIVRRIYINTPGGRLRPGDVVMEIVPSEGDLVFEARLKPGDVSSVKEGMAARIKIDAYDYTVYGSLRSRVRYVSPDALVDRGLSGETHYYQLQLTVDPREVARLNQSHPGLRAMAMQPGLSGIAEVEGPSRTVLDYLFKPIVKTFSEALSEK